MGVEHSNAHRQLTTKPSFSGIPPSTGKHTWKTVPQVLVYKCVLNVCIYLDVVSEFWKRWQLLETAKTRGWKRIGHFPTNFSIGQKTAAKGVSEFSVRRMAQNHNALHGIKFWPTVKGFCHRPWPITLHCPCVLLISLPRDFMSRMWSLLKYFWTLLALGHGSKFHLQSISSLFSTYQNPLLPWKHSLKLTPDPEVFPNWLHFFLPRGQPSVVWISAVAVSLVSKLSPELLFKQGLH